MITQQRHPSERSRPNDAIGPGLTNNQILERGQGEGGKGTSKKTCSRGSQCSPRAANMIPRFRRQRLPGAVRLLVVGTVYVLLMVMLSVHRGLSGEGHWSPIGEEESDDPSLPSETTDGEDMDRKYPEIPKDLFYSDPESRTKRQIPVFIWDEDGRQKAVEQREIESNKSAKCVRRDSAGTFPDNFVPESIMNLGGVVIHVFLTFYAFVAIALICDIYFVPSLEHICEDLHLQANVAGATFMAMASSAPEFCTSVVGVFVAGSDLSLGAIVGSSIFNLLFIVGAVGVFAGMEVSLAWFPLARDSLFYVIAIIEMTIFIHDTYVTWIEATIMILTYLVYVIFMAFNDAIERRAMSCVGQREKRTSTAMQMARQHSRIRTSKPHQSLMMMVARPSHPEVPAPGPPKEESLESFEPVKESMHVIPVAGSDMTVREWRPSQPIPWTNLEVRSSPADLGPEMTLEEWQDSHALPPINLNVRPSHVDPRSRVSLNPMESDVTVRVWDGPPPEPWKNLDKRSSPVDVKRKRSTPGLEHDEGAPFEEEVEDYPEKAPFSSPFILPHSLGTCILYSLMFPVILIHYLTIPDSRMPGWRRRAYIFTFAICIMYLALYSYFMVWMVEIIGGFFQIQISVTALTILAAGTSVPDCMSSIFVARDGYGDMAVSNALGSNVFDILLCLGIPWLLDNLLYEKIHGNAIDSNGLIYVTFSLVLTIIFLIVSLITNNFRLTYWYGMSLIFVYFLVITICILIETNVFFQFNPPPCKT